MRIGLASYKNGFDRPTEKDAIRLIQPSIIVREGRVETDSLFARVSESVGTDRIRLVLRNRLMAFITTI
jgi:hypothetical protein